MAKDLLAQLGGQLRTNPYPVYHVLRRSDPVHWSPSWSAWFVTRHQDVSQALKDSRLSVSHISDFSSRLGEAHDMSRLERTLAGWLIFMDPPAHTRLRALISRSFTPRTLQRMEDSVEGRVDLLLEAIDPAQGPVDLMKALAQPLPVMTVAEILGAEGDPARFHNWSHRLATFLGEERLTLEVVRQAEEAIEGLESSFGELVARRRQQPADDLVSTMLAAREEGHGLTDEEVVSMATLLFAAGHDTTTNLIGNALGALLLHPLELRKAVAEPQKIEAAIEEVLRWDCPAQVVSRHAVQELELGGRRILPGQLVNLALGAANRDPELFVDPDRFDIDRPDNQRHLGFGKGIHTCIGNHLARLEARVALAGVLGRWPNLRLAVPPQRYPSVAFRRLKDLLVELK